MCVPLGGYDAKNLRFFRRFFRKIMKIMKKIALPKQEFAEVLEYELCMYGALEAQL